MKTTPGKAGLGICDWTLNLAGKPEAFLKAKELGFDGVQVAFDVRQGSLSLTNERIQGRCLKAAEKTGVRICSAAAVNYLQDPLALSEAPVAVMASYIKAMGNLGISTILLPFFGRGDINEKTTLIASVTRRLRHLPAKDSLLKDTIEILKRIAEIAETAGVTVGVETLMRAERIQDVLARVGSPNIKVYFDAGNAYLMGYRIVDEIRMLGLDAICQIHLKEKRTTIGAGRIDYDRFVKFLAAEGYGEWLIVEKSVRHWLGLDKSMRRNVAYLKSVTG